MSKLGANVTLRELPQVSNINDHCSSYDTRACLTVPFVRINPGYRVRTFFLVLPGLASGHVEFMAARNFVIIVAIDGL